MKNKYVFVVIMLCCILFVSVGVTNIYVNANSTEEKTEDFVIVTSFYPMYIATMNVVEDVSGVSLKNLSEPQTGCLHDFQLTPEDMKLLSTADVFIVNGGGIESFMEEIAKSYPDLVIIEACEGIALLDGEHDHEDETEHVHGEDEGHVHEMEDELIHDGESNEDAHNHDEDVNAHAWMSVSLYRKQVENIMVGLAKANPQNADVFKSNAANYDAKLLELEKEQKEVIALAQGKSAIMFHCAFDYVAEDYGLCVEYCMDLDEERQVSAGEVADVLSVIEKEGVQYIFAEELYGKSMCDMVQKETDVTVIYLDPLNRGEYEADSYVEAMSRNIELIKEAFISY